jgi:hypothetical protein
VLNEAFWHLIVGADPVFGCACVLYTTTTYLIYVSTISMPTFLYQSNP